MSNTEAAVPEKELRGTVLVTKSPETKQIILPVEMSAEDAITWLQRKIKEDSTLVQLHEVIDAFPFDAAHAFYQVLCAKYGWVNLTQPGLFKPPARMLGLSVGVDQTIQVPWGELEIPGIKGKLLPTMAVIDGKVQFILAGVIRRKHEAEMHDLANEVREYLRTNSIYKGKAFSVEFYSESELIEGEVNPDNKQPKFLDLRHVDKQPLIFSDDVMDQINTSIFTPIERTHVVRAHKVPLKRGILLEGPFGTGKTLTAYATARKCEKNGWTFIYAKTKNLVNAIRLALQYQPAVVFCEDIDQAAESTKGLRIPMQDTNFLEEVRNTLDGIDTKNTELMVILTTNYVDDIQKALLRPGRLDAVISVRPPDLKAAAKLIREYAGSLLDPDATLEGVCSLMKGHIPAFIREVVERSKLAAIAQDKGDGTRLVLTDHALEVAARGMIDHLNLLEEEEEDARSELVKAAEIVVDGFAQYTNGHAKA